MNRLLAILLLSLSCFAQTGGGAVLGGGASISTVGTATPTHTFTLVAANTNGSCPNGLNTCTVTTTSTGTGNILIINLAHQSTPVRTLSSISAGGVFVHCSNCSQITATNEAVDQGYVLSSTGGVTSIVVTLSGAPSTNFELEIDEYSYTGGGSVVFDNSNSQVNASCTSCATATVTVGSTSDLISRVFNSHAGSSAPGGVWVNPGHITTTGTFAAINQSSAAVTVTQTSGGEADSGMSFK